MNVNLSNFKILDTALGQQETTTAKSTNEDKGFSTLIKTYLGATNTKKSSPDSPAIGSNLVKSTGKLTAQNGLLELSNSSKSKIGKTKDGKSTVTGDELMKLISELLGSLNSISENKTPGDKAAPEDALLKMSAVKDKDVGGSTSLGTLNSILELLKLKLQSNGKTEQVIPETINNLESPSDKAPNSLDVTKGTDSLAKEILNIKDMLQSLLSKLDVSTTKIVDTNSIDEVKAALKGLLTNLQTETKGQVVDTKETKGRAVDTKENKGQRVEASANGNKKEQGAPLETSIKLLLTKLNTLLEKTDNNPTAKNGVNDLIKPIVEKLNALLEPIKDNDKLSKTLDPLNTDSIKTKKDDTTPVDSLASKDITQLLVNNLNSIIEAIKPTNAPVVNGDGNLKQIIQDLIEGIDLNSLKNLNLSGVIPKSGKDTTNANDFKNKLVEMLVTLTNDNTTSGSGAENIKTSVVEKFVNLLNQEAKKEELAKPTVVKDNNIVLDNEKTKDIPKTVMNNQDSSKVLKEEKLLKTMIGGNEDNKAVKVNTFIAQLNSSKESLNSIQSPDKPVINKANFIPDVIKVVKFMDVNDLKELTVKIAPKGLGDITIKLTMDAGTLKANISANTKETYNLLNSNSTNLTNALGNSDIKIQSVNINVYQDDTTFFNDNFSGSNNQNNSRKNQGKNEIEEIAGIGDGNEENSSIDGNLSILV